MGAVYPQALASADGGSTASVAAGFPRTPESPVWTWARLNKWYGPLPHWARLRVPVLVAYGEEDERDNVPVAESVERLEAALREAEHPSYTIRVLSGSGHALWDPASNSHAPKLRGTILWTCSLRGSVSELAHDSSRHPRRRLKATAQPSGPPTSPHGPSTPPTGARDLR